MLPSAGRLESSLHGALSRINRSFVTDFFVATRIFVALLWRRIADYKVQSILDDSRHRPRAFAL